MCDRFKFRAWHKEVSELIYEDRLGDCFRWYNDGQPVKLMQCTGLKDKNGVLIYEGDIVNDGDELFRVSWNGSAWILEDITDCGCDELFYFLNTKGIEVIGNIHENLELLEATNV